MPKFKLKLLEIKQNVPHWLYLLTRCSKPRICKNRSRDYILIPIIAATPPPPTRTLVNLNKWLSSKQANWIASWISFLWLNTVLHCYATPWLPWCQPRILRQAVRNGLPNEVINTLGLICSPNLTHGLILILSVKRDLMWGNLFSEMLVDLITGNL